MACRGGAIDTRTIKQITVSHIGHKETNGIRSFDSDWQIQFGASNAYIYTGSVVARLSGPIDFRAYRSYLQSIPQGGEDSVRRDEFESFQIELEDQHSRKFLASPDSQRNAITAYAESVYNHVHADQRRQADVIARRVGNFGGLRSFRFMRTGGFSVHPSSYWLVIDKRGRAELRWKQGDEVKAYLGMVDQRQLRALLIASNIARVQRYYPIRATDTIEAKLLIRFDSGSISATAPDRLTWPESLRTIDRGLSWLMLTASWTPPLQASVCAKLSEIMLGV